MPAVTTTSPSSSPSTTATEAPRAFPDPDRARGYAIVGTFDDPDDGSPLGRGIERRQGHRCSASPLARAARDELSRHAGENQGVGGRGNGHAPAIGLRCRVGLCRELGERGRELPGRAGHPAPPPASGISARPGAATSGAGTSKDIDSVSSLCRTAIGCFACTLAKLSTRRRAMMAGEGRAQARIGEPRPGGFHRERESFDRPHAARRSLPHGAPGPGLAQHLALPLERPPRRSGAPRHPDPVLPWRLRCVRTTRASGSQRSSAASNLRPCGPRRRLPARRDPRAGHRTSAPATAPPPAQADSSTAQAPPRSPAYRAAQRGCPPRPGARPGSANRRSARTPGKTAPPPGRAGRRRGTRAERSPPRPRPRPS